MTSSGKAHRRTVPGLAIALALVLAAGDSSVYVRGGTASTSAPV